MERTIDFGNRLEREKWVSHTKMEHVGRKIGIGDINQK